MADEKRPPSKMSQNSDENDADENKNSGYSKQEQLLGALFSQGLVDTAGIDWDQLLSDTEYTTKGSASKALSRLQGSIPNYSEDGNKGSADGKKKKKRVMKISSLDITPPLKKRKRDHDGEYFVHECSSLWGPSLC